MNLFTRGAYVTELETRYTLFSRPGKFRVAVWADTYFSGSYREAIDLTADQSGPRSERCDRPDAPGAEPNTATT